MSDSRDPHQAALKYAQQGLRVVPIKPGEKRPALNAWQDLATTDLEQINLWYLDKYKGHGVGIATGDASGVFVLDVDNHDSLHDLEATHGKLPQTLTSITGSGGAHHLFSYPSDGRRIHNSASGILPGLDIRGERGQIVAPPTKHPNGQRYEWDDECSTIAAAPEWLLDLVCEKVPAPGPPLKLVSNSDRPGDIWAAATDWAEILEADGWKLHHTDRQGERHWTRPGKELRDGASATTGFTSNDHLKMFSSSHPQLRTEETYSKLGYLAAVHHQGDFKAASKQLAAEGYRADPATSPESGEVVSTAVEGDDGTTRRVAANLPASFYDERPELAHIRAAAHCRARSADAVLGVVLARIAVLSPPSLRLPAPVDSEATLDMAVAIIGRSGSGKSGAAKVARDLLPIDADDLAELPLGSGEGITEAYLEMVEEIDANGKLQKVKRQVKRGVLFMLDEGQALAEMGGRSGSTLLPTIRSAWAGEQLGQANASEERRRKLPAHEYRFALVAGFQLEYATALLDDHAGGTPQRFLYLPAQDPSIPDDAPAWPGALEWHPPVHSAGPMGLDPNVAAEIRRRALALSRDEITDVDPLDSRRDLVRLKVAGLLAVFAGRTDISGDDWRLAGQILATSDKVRASIVDAARFRKGEAERTKGVTAALRARTLDDDVTSRALTTAAKAIGRHVHKGECSGGCKRRCVTHCMSSKTREHVALDDAISEAISQGYVTHREGIYELGQVKP